ncbi:MAG: hypothetical protein E8G75_03955 [Sulfitobacter sp. SK025]|nr:MAG: hypothetical protein E8G75_03955 [Sulfitobacter sp. SK025]
MKVVVDTTEVAEFDIKGYQINDADLETIAKELRDNALSESNRTVGDIKVREMKGYDVAFIVGRDDDRIIITIGGLELPDREMPMEKVIKGLGYIATVRGAFGA